MVFYRFQKDKAIFKKHFYLVETRGVVYHIVELFCDEEKMKKLCLMLVALFWVACGKSSGTSQPVDPGITLDTIEITLSNDCFDVEQTTKDEVSGGPDAMENADPGAALDLEVDSGPRFLEGCPKEGDLVITEIMFDPLVSGDTYGEFFEVFNKTEFYIDLRGVVLQSGTEKHVVSASSPVVIAPGQYFVFAKNGDSALNGGITPDYVYSKITLSNTADEISILCDNVFVDRVVYNKGAGWPYKAGRTLSLDPNFVDATENDDPTVFCLGSTAFGKGDFGSPGKENPSCAPVSCGDKVQQRWEECDDGNTKPNDGCEPDCKLSPDTDGDGVPDYKDNCPTVPNPDQTDSDGDKKGDACDNAECGNGVIEADEECDDKNKTPGDGCENDCTLSKDTDGDGVYDSVDNCPSVQNPSQGDIDGDGIGDDCDPPECGNGVIEGDEECDDKNKLSGDGCSAKCKVESFEVGSVIVTEFMYDPSAADDTNGEYVELYNTLDVPVDIAGWKLEDGNQDSVLILPPEGELVIEPHDFVVLGRNADFFFNGGVPVDYAYGSKFNLANSRDRIMLVWNNTIIDKVEYAIGNTFPKATGHSLSLDPSKFSADANDIGANWCPTPDQYELDGGDFGTPGEMNPPCVGAN
jgi:cysteine-rich repeat protein